MWSFFVKLARVLCNLVPCPSNSQLGGNKGQRIVVHDSRTKGRANPNPAGTFRAGSIVLEVDDSHRSSLKPWWHYFGPYSALRELDKRSLLDEKARLFLVSAVGGRTLTSSLEEARAVLQPYLTRHRNLFMTETVPDLEKRPMKPSRPQVVREIESHARRHSETIKKLEQRDLLPSDRKLRVLEIGYTSGGASVFGWEMADCEAHAIDYFFGGAVHSDGRHSYLSEIIGSQAQFHIGDITKETPLPSAYFDVVYSSSVVEHLNNLPQAFEEITRLLRPGGISIHKYDPYFHPLGGHSLGTLDSPWGHVRLSKSEILDYIQVMRPLEAEAAIPWVRSALYPEHTQSQVQSAVTGAGLLLREWRTSRVEDTQALLLTDEIVSDALRIHPGLSLAELVTKNVSFIAQKGL